MNKRFLMIAIASIMMLPASAYSLSNVGKAHIKKHESCQLTAYWDSNGYSIGYGHHNKSVTKGMRISKKQADKLFNEDVKVVENAANKMLSKFKCNFSQSFFDGLCDLIYNCGESGVKNSEFWKRMSKCRIQNKKINKNDLNFTIAAVKTMRIYAEGHKARRYETHLMMLKN
jgi:GH24 family phage-related lysozyme (muramidase)